MDCCSKYPPDYRYHSVRGGIGMGTIPNGANIGTNGRFVNESAAYFNHPVPSMRYYQQHQQQPHFNHHQHHPHHRNQHSSMYRLTPSSAQSSLYNGIGPPSAAGIPLQHPPLPPPSPSPHLIPSSTNPYPSSYECYGNRSNTTGSTSSYPTHIGTYNNGYNSNGFPYANSNFNIRSGMNGGYFGMRHYENFQRPSSNGDFPQYHHQQQQQQQPNHHGIQLNFQNFRNNRSDLYDNLPLPSPQQNIPERNPGYHNNIYSSHPSNGARDFLHPTSVNSGYCNPSQLITNSNQSESDFPLSQSHLHSQQQNPHFHPINNNNQLRQEQNENHFENSSKNTFSQNVADDGIKIENDIKSETTVNNSNHNENQNHLTLSENMTPPESTITELNCKVNKSDETSEERKNVISAHYNDQKLLNTVKSETNSLENNYPNDNDNNYKNSVIKSEISPKDDDEGSKTNDQHKTVQSATGDLYQLSTEFSYDDLSEMKTSKAKINSTLREKDKAFPGTNRFVSGSNPALAPGASVPGSVRGRRMECSTPLDSSPILERCATPFVHSYPSSPCNIPSKAQSNGYLHSVRTATPNHVNGNWSPYSSSPSSWTYSPKPVRKRVYSPRPSRASPMTPATPSSLMSSGNMKNRILEHDVIPNKKSRKRRASNTNANVDENLEDPYEFHDETKNVTPLPGFQQAFGSTERGKFSETFLSSSNTNLLSDNSYDLLSMLPYESEPDTMSPQTWETGDSLEGPHFNLHIGASVQPVYSENQNYMNSPLGGNYFNEIQCSNY